MQKNNEKINKAEKYIQRMIDKKREQAQTDIRMRRGRLVQILQNLVIIIRKYHQFNHQIRKYTCDRQNQRNTKFYGNWHKKEQKIFMDL